MAAEILVCPACRHATRKHHSDGWCGAAGDCWCDMSPEMINRPAAAAAEPVPGSSQRAQEPTVQVCICGTGVHGLHPRCPVHRDDHERAVQAIIAAGESHASEPAPAVPPAPATEPAPAADPPGPSVVVDDPAPAERPEPAASPPLRRPTPTTRRRPAPQPRAPRPFVAPALERAAAAAGDQIKAALRSAAPEVLGRWDSWSCQGCGSRRFEAFDCCGAAAIAVTLTMTRREVSGDRDSS